jgi:glycosyltransferase involved in cell wall biosynthesis
VRLAVWSPLPPSPSGIADYVAETLPHLVRLAEVQAVVEDPAQVDPRLARALTLRSPAEVGDVDLDVYHIGNSPAHGYVYRGALVRPGVVVLHDWSLHHLVLCETVEKKDASRYLREMRRSHGERGTFVGRQVARALGGEMLPALYPLNDRVLERSLGVVALSEYVRERAARRIPDRPVLHLPHHLSLPLAPLPSRDEARRALGLPADGAIVTAPGLATAAKRLDVAIRVVGHLRGAFPSLCLVVAGQQDPTLPLNAWACEAGLGEDAFVLTGRLTLDDFIRHLVAADVILALRFPTYGEMSGALVRALGVGRPALVTAGTPAALEFPDGVVVPVDPWPNEEAQLSALLEHLVANPPLRESIGRLARAHALAHLDLPRSVETLVSFLAEVHAGKAARLAALRADAAPEGSMLDDLLEEVRWAARDLGLSGVHLGLEEILGSLCRNGR